MRSTLAYRHSMFATVFSTMSMQAFILSLSVGGVAAQPSLALAETAVLAPITVLGDQSSADAKDLVPTIQVLSGAALQKKKQSTLGETLAAEPGVSSSQFGPNASRPVIRGLDGERLRILQSGIGNFDASGTSQDHAVVMDPLSVDRIEIVRGPAVLLYGSGAIGGVVNVVTNRIREIIPEKLEIEGLAGFATADMKREFAARIDAPASPNLNFHFDGSLRGAEDYRATESIGTVANSWNRGRSLAVGTSYVRGPGFAGLSVAQFKTDYGTVAEPNVSIAMEQTRVDFAGGFKSEGAIESIRLKGGSSDYNHKEVNSGVTGTTFRNRGTEIRTELRHRALGPLVGTVGLQGSQSVFEAKGSEAFLPTTNSSAMAIFFSEDLAFDGGAISAGARAENYSVQAEDDVKFGVGSKKFFVAGSGSVGAKLDMSGVSALVLNLGYSERAPNYQELFANGAHVATSQFEIGDSGLGKELSRSLELSYRYGETTGIANPRSATITAFLQDFSSFISMRPTGATDADSGLAVWRAAAVEAQIFGAEAELKLPVADSGFAEKIRVELTADWLQGKNKTTGNYLPRMTPPRIAASLIYQIEDGFEAGMDIRHVLKQSQTAPAENETAAYTLLGASIEKSWVLGEMVVASFVKASNILDVEARNHVSVLKDKAPLPGKNFSLGIRALF